MPVTGKEVSYSQQGLKPVLKNEAAWAWEAISSSTCCKSMTIMYAGSCVFQAGLLPEGSKPGRAVNGSICKQVMQSGKANFLANLVLYPGVHFDASLLPCKAHRCCIRRCQRWSSARSEMR